MQSQLLASGEYILLMDNDDELAPSALHEFYQKKKKKVLISYTAIWILLMRKEKREIHYVNLTGLPDLFPEPDVFRTFDWIQEVLI